MIENYFEQNPELKVLSDKLFQARESGELLLQSGDVGWASAPSNIALLKYWGKRNGKLQIPENSNLSLTLTSFRAYTQASVLGRFVPLSQGRIVHSHERPKFTFELNKKAQTMPAKMEIFARALLHGYADDISLSVRSLNNFPTACGVASSAAGYAALVGAVADLLNLKRFFSDEEIQFWISEWSRLGSGSATRSAIIKDDSRESQFVSWEQNSLQMNSTTSALKVHSKFRRMEHCLLVLDSDEKSVESSQGHVLAQTSLFQNIRLAQYPQRFSRFCKALAEGDFELMQDLSEWDALEMHAVMATSAQTVQYISQMTSQAISKFVSLRNKKSAKMLWTLDAGANPHFVFLPESLSFMAEYFCELANDPLFTEAKVIFGDTLGPGLLMGVESSARETLLDSNVISLNQLSLLEAADLFRKRGTL